MQALFSQHRPDVIAAKRGKTPGEITPPALLSAYRTAEKLRTEPGAES